MAKKQPKAESLVTLEYCGPVGETSHLFGALEVGRHYQADSELAAFLLAANPTHWREPNGEAVASSASKG